MFSVIHTDGSGEENPTVDTLENLYDELRTADGEHGDVAVLHESGWSISAHRDGRLVFEHLGGEGAPRHMFPVSKERVLQLWLRLIEGDISGLAREAWRPGYVEQAPPE